MTDFDDLNLDPLSFDDLDEDAEPEAPTKGRKGPKQAAWSKFSDGINMDPPIVPKETGPERLLAVYQNVVCDNCKTPLASQFIGLFVGRTLFYEKAQARHLKAYDKTRHNINTMRRDFIFLEGDLLVPVCLNCMSKWRTSTNKAS